LVPPAVFSNGFFAVTMMVLVFVMVPTIIAAWLPMRDGGEATLSTPKQLASANSRRLPFSADARHSLLSGFVGAWLEGLQYGPSRPTNREMTISVG